MTMMTHYVIQYRRTDMANPNDVMLELTFLAASSLAAEAQLYDLEPDAYIVRVDRIKLESQRGLTPPEVLARFHDHWNGTHAELDAALEVFYMDIMDIMHAAMHDARISPATQDDITGTVEEHVITQYLVS